MNAQCLTFRSLYRFPFSSLATPILRSYSVAPTISRILSLQMHLLFPFLEFLFFSLFTQKIIKISLKYYYFCKQFLISLDLGIFSLWFNRILLKFPLLISLQVYLLQRLVILRQGFCHIHLCLTSAKYCAWLLHCTHKTPRE